MTTIYTFDKLIEIIAVLRSPEGCPWDRKQTYSSIKAHTLEEVYELFDAIENKDYENIKEELGDVLLQIIFYSQFAAEEQKFNINDVIETLCEKLIHRHPHVFGDAQANNAKEALINWEQSKKTKKPNRSLFDGVPRELPGLLKAFRLCQKASNLGFEWPSVDGAINKLEEEIKELKVECEKGNQKLIEEEFGDILFTLANTARFMNINPEAAIQSASQKFINRFHLVEKMVDNQKLNMHELSTEKLNELWQKSKRELEIKEV